MISRTTVHHVTKDEATINDFHRSIRHYHKCLAEDFVQGDHYASDLDGIEVFINDDVTNPYYTYKEAQNRPNAILYVDDYVNNSEHAKSAADSYDTDIGADLNFPYVDGNAVYGSVKKQVCNYDGQAVGVVNQNPLLDTIR